MNAAFATARAVLTIPGTEPQQLHPPAVTRGAWLVTLGAFIVAAAPYAGALAGLTNPLTTLLGAALAAKIVAAASIFAAVVGVRSAHIAATGRSIVAVVDNPRGEPPSTQPASPAVVLSPVPVAPEAAGLFSPPSVGTADVRPTIMANPFAGEVADMLIAAAEARKAEILPLIQSAEGGVEAAIVNAIKNAPKGSGVLALAMPLLETEIVTYVTGLVAKEGPAVVFAFLDTEAHLLAKDLGG